MGDLDSSGFAALDRLMELVRQTHVVLAAVAGEGSLPDGGADYLATRTLPHVEGIRAGFRGWLRTEMAGPAELRYLILQAGSFGSPPSSEAERWAAAAEALLEGRSRGGPPRLAEETGEALWALAHARLVFGVLPRLPDDAVRYPTPPRTYADIAVPKGPAELVARIEEIERELWHTATGRRLRSGDPAFRRTYGFFDAADQLRGGGLRVAG